MKNRVGEADLSSKGYSTSDERRILDALGSGLAKEFPNPGRVGCPDCDVLKRIASHEMPLSEAEKWLDHLGSCSPCYADLKRLQEAHEWRRKRMLLATAAGVLLAIGIAGWAVLHKRNENLIAQTAVLDLRDRSVARGVEPSDTERPLELTRSASSVTILLPLGSTEGSYDLRIADLSGRASVETAGTTDFSDHTISVRVRMNLRGLQSGNYLLEIRRAGEKWESYPVVLR